MNCKCTSQGRMPHRVTVNKPDPTASDDTVGQQTITWIPHMKKVFAEVKAMKPREVIQANQPLGVMPYTVTLVRSRRSTSIDSDMQLVWHRGAHGDKTLSIVGPAADLHPERKVRLTAVEVD